MQTCALLLLFGCPLHLLFCLMSSTTSPLSLLGVPFLTQAQIGCFQSYAIVLWCFSWASLRFLGEIAHETENDSGGNEEIKRRAMRNRKKMMHTLDSDPVQPLGTIFGLERFCSPTRVFAVSCRCLIFAFFRPPTRRTVSYYDFDSTKTSGARKKKR